MNTPDPNPSPELRNHIAACRFCGSTTAAEPIKDNRKLWAVRCGCGLHGTWNTRRYGAIESWNDRAHRHRMAALKESLSPQTLPAPGKVDFRALLIEAGRNAGALLDDRVSDEFLKGIPEEVRLKIERLREDTRTIQRNTATYRQEARAEADASNERAAEANKRADNMAEANRRLLAMFEADPSSLATVAAANDEGVADLRETIAMASRCQKARHSDVEPVERDNVLREASTLLRRLAATSASPTYAEGVNEAATVAESWKSPLRSGTDARLLGHQEAARSIAAAIRLLPQGGGK